MTYKELAHSLERLGMRHVAELKGAHRWADPSSGASIVVADQGPDQLNAAVINRVLESLNISSTELLIEAD